MLKNQVKKNTIYQALNIQTFTFLWKFFPVFLISNSDLFPTFHTGLKVLFVS